jgi:phosphatidate cytidylyltransferase
MSKRVLSAFVMLMIFIPIFIIGGFLFKMFICFIGATCLFEYLIALKSNKDLPFSITIFCFLSFISLFLYSINSYYFSISYSFLTFILFLFIIPLIFYHDVKIYSISDCFYLLFGIIVFDISFSSMIVLRSMNFLLLVYLLLIAVVSDTFAYLIGSFMGHKKLIIDVSFSKTVEGFIGGILFGTFIPVMFYISFIGFKLNIILLILITLFLSILSSLGDLFFSFIKRNFGIKNFSEIIPGHGGVLDRFDSIIFVILGFTLFIDILGG